MYPHRIRLREPWTRDVVAGGGVQLRRGFHRPTIEAGERVWIVCEAMTRDADVLLDGATLGTFAAGAALWSCDVTDQLTARHELTFVVAEPCEELPWREVRLEVRLHSSPE